MNHKDTPQPGEKAGWFKNQEDQWDRPWDEEDMRQFHHYYECLMEAGKTALAERFKLEVWFVEPSTLLNRMAARIAKAPRGEASC